MRFNNLNLDNTRKEKEFTKEDVKSEKMQVTHEQIGYKKSDSVAELGKRVNASESSNAAFNLKFIPREKIQFNKNNDFPIRDIEELAASLLNVGMQHNLGAFYDDEGDCYILESGERRLRACDMLFERYSGMENGSFDMQEQENVTLYMQNIAPFYEKGFPVNVKKAKYSDEDETYQKVDEIDSELRKYRVNIDVREFTPQERANYIQKIQGLIEERNRLVYGEKARKPTQAEIASAVGTSERQLRKYKALDDLIPALKAEFERGNISINKVPGIAALPEEEQMIFLDLLQRGRNVTPEQVAQYKERSEIAEKEKRAALEDKKRLEEELEEIKQKNAVEVAAVIEETRQKEQKIRTEIENAVRAKNEDLILKLQKELEKEKESSDRLIGEANKSLEATKKALGDANRRIAELSDRDSKEETILKTKAELDIQMDMLEQIAKRFWKLFEQYKWILWLIKRR